MSDVGIRLKHALAGRYEVERELGHGGMATVHLARDVKHGRTVAIKVLKPELAQAVGSERFLREINLAAQLQSPHILPLLESGEADGLLYYVMPYVRGDSLRGLLARQGALAPSEAMRLLRDVVDGVAHAHRHHVVHRDIKPDNVMVADRHAIVMDLGIAKAIGEVTATVDLTNAGISLGTPAYMAPEQAAADPLVDHRADIYSIGVLAYEMLSGKPPFAGAQAAVLAAHITTPPRPLLEVQPETPPAIARIVMKCLEKDPAQRYQTADELLEAIESLATPAGTSMASPEPAHRRTRLLVAGGIGLLAVAIIATLGVNRLRTDRWVHGIALPELRRLAEGSQSDSAFGVALRIQAAAPRDTALMALWPMFSRTITIRSEPEGVSVYRAPMADTSAWHFMGITPLDSVRVPLAAGLFRFEKPAHRTAYSIFGAPAFAVDAGYVAPLHPLLDPVDAPDPEMIRVPGGLTRAFLVGTDAATPLTLGEYRIDRFEVTNNQYQAFVDAGGYATPRYWEHPFTDEGGRSLSFDEAVRRFTDRTGRPGPGTWEAGAFPAGQGEMPVSGVSWYEAAAYAKWAGKSLPTVYHWARAAGILLARYVVPASNLDAGGPLPVGIPRAVSVTGASDMAGNVREWVTNDAGRGQRFILGGGWRDPRYAFVDAYAQPPMDRSEINGFRLARYDAADSSVVAASRPIPRAFTDFSRERPVPDAVFAGFLPQFDYDPTPLDATVELRDSTSQSWLLEKVSFMAAYGGERMSAWVYLPRSAKPPYQAVVVFPGSNAIGAEPFRGALPSVMSFLPAGGRVLVYPIYKSTHERSDSLRSDIADQSIFWRDHVMMWVKDFRRTLDYLGTRADIDTAKFAYFGFSWGGYMGGIIPAAEPRIKTALLYVAGLTMERGRQEVEPINFLPRIRIPVLMLNGRYDFFFPVETAQKPFFEFLGTPAEHKKWSVYEGGHDVPRTDLIRESLAWLDKYLGPVR